MLRAAVARGAVGVPDPAPTGSNPSRARTCPYSSWCASYPAASTPDELGARERGYPGRMTRVISDHFPERRRLDGDSVDLQAIALALPRCRLITCDAFMADVVRRTRLDVLCDAEVFTGRRAASTACANGWRN